jgi:hypothetical protein
MFGLSTTVRPTFPVSSRLPVEISHLLRDESSLFIILPGDELLRWSHRTPLPLSPAICPTVWCCRLVTYKLMLHVQLKVYVGNRGVAPLVLNFGTRWRWVVKSGPGFFTPGIGPPYLLNRKRGGPQS